MTDTLDAIRERDAVESAFGPTHGLFVSYANSYVRQVASDRRTLLRLLDAAQAEVDALLVALTIIAAPSEPAPDTIGVTARNIARAALAALDEVGGKR